MKLNKNDTFSVSNNEYTVLDLLGDGGQGIVYKVSDGANSYALKMYKNNPSADFKYNLKNNILKGSPAPTYLWPKECVELDDESFGYIMDLRPSNYHDFIHYLNGKTTFKSKRIMLDWTINLVRSFKVLHEAGFSYQDINDGSFFFDPDTGELLICDNDNVTADKKNLGIKGMMRFMAPEIVRGDIDPLTKVSQMPDTHSDRFSLAVILFYTLCMGNPFSDGECLKDYIILDEKAEFEIFGKHPVYIFNELDKSNRPIRGYHTAILNRYPSLPSYIKEAFHKTFTLGLEDRENGRVTEIEWLKLLCRYRDELISCSCGHEYIYGFNEKNQNIVCPKCKQQTRAFCYLQINKFKILLEPNKYIYKFHLDKYSSEYNVPVCMVVQNKNNPQLWGIKLNLDQDVLIKDLKGNEKTIDKSGVIPIVSGLQIDFGGVTAQIICQK